MSEDDKLSTKTQSGFSGHFLSKEFVWLYRFVVFFFFFVGTVFMWFGFLQVLQAFYERIGFISGIVMVSLGALLFLIGFSVISIRRYITRLRDDANLKIASVALKNIGENEEEFEKAKQIRQDLADFEFRRNLERHFVVTHMTLNNVILFPNTDWELQPGVNVLLGRNGYGKSLLLRSLVGALQKDDETTKSMLKSKSSSSIELKLLQDGEPALVRRTWKRFEKSVGKVPVLAIPDARLMDRSQLVIGPDDTANSDLRVHGATHFLQQRPFGSMIQGFLYEICLDYWDHGRSFDLPVFAFIQECVRRLTNYDFEFVSIGRSGRTGFNIMVITEGNSEPLPIQYASQGTLSVLTMFGLIRSYLQTFSEGPGDSLVEKHPGIVLIDEADAHLHPVWQQKVPSLLRDLFPNVQFVLTAHSPLFVAGCWRGEVAVLRKPAATTDNAQANGFLIEQLNQDFVGVSAEEIYNKIFEIEELDDTYLEYSKKVTIQGSTADEINNLEARNKNATLSTEEQRHLRNLKEESRRLMRTIEIRGQRQSKAQETLRVEELESRIDELEAQLGSKET